MRYMNRITSEDNQTAVALERVQRQRASPGGVGTAVLYSTDYGIWQRVLSDGLMYYDVCSQLSLGLRLRVRLRQFCVIESVSPRFRTAWCHPSGT
jgi:hypothetical protein